MRVRPIDIHWNDNPKAAVYRGGAQPGDTLIYKGVEMRIHAITRRAYILRPFAEDADVRHEPFARKVNVFTLDKSSTPA